MRVSRHNDFVTSVKVLNDPKSTLHNIPLSGGLILIHKLKITYLICHILDYMINFGNRRFNLFGPKLKVEGENDRDNRKRLTKQSRLKPVELTFTTILIEDEYSHNTLNLLYYVLFVFRTTDCIRFVKCVMVQVNFNDKIIT